jgi:hypothetical protein
MENPAKPVPRQTIALVKARARVCDVGQSGRLGPDSQTKNGPLRENRAVFQIRFEEGKRV